MKWSSHQQNYRHLISLGEEDLLTSKLSGVLAKASIPCHMDLTTGLRHGIWLSPEQMIRDRWKCNPFYNLTSEYLFTQPNPDEMWGDTGCYTRKQESMGDLGGWLHTDNHQRWVWIKAHKESLGVLAYISKNITLCWFRGIQVALNW